MLSQFANYLKSDDKTESTVTAYCTNIRIFSDWFSSLNGSDMTPVAVTPLDIKFFREHCKSEGLAASTINHRLISLNQFFNWCVKTERVVSNPVTNIKLVRVSSPVAPRWLTRQEVYSILRTLLRRAQLAQLNDLQPTYQTSIQYSAIVQLMLNAGLRVSEACNLHQSQLVLKSRSGSVTIYGKHNKYRKIPLNLDVRKALTDWLEVSGCQGFLFAPRGKPIDRRSVNFYISKLGNEADLEVDSLHPHAFRHTFCKNLIDAGNSLEKVAMLAGHKSLDVTKIYTMPSYSDLERSVNSVAWGE